MKKLFKYFKFLILLILINQFVILTLNDTIRKGFWKVSGVNRLDGNDVLELNSNLHWNLISVSSEKTAIVQLYLGKKLLISNLTLTDWYWYENKG